MDQEKRKAALTQLATLQDEEAHLAAVIGDLKKVPERISVIEKTLSGAEAQLAAAKQAVADASKERRVLEQEIDTVKGVISKYQGQLMEVKTNEQYRALTQEIATQKRKIEAIEEKILINMEKVDGLNRTIQGKDAALGEEKKRVAAEKAVLDRERQKLEQEKAERDQTLAGLRAAIPAEVLSLYRRIASTRAGIGLSRTRDGACGECRVRARPQALAESRAFERIVQCDNCQRILYVTEQPPVVAPLVADVDDLAGH